MVKVAIFFVAMCMAAITVMLTPHAKAAISCGQVINSLTPCIPYVTKGGALPGLCCSGIRSLNSQASTTPARQAACNCIKSAAESINGLNLKTAAALPRYCGVNLPYNISPSINCTTVH